MDINTRSWASAGRRAGRSGCPIFSPFRDYSDFALYPCPLFLKNIVTCLFLSLCYSHCCVLLSLLVHYLFLWLFLLFPLYPLCFLDISLLFFVYLSIYLPVYLSLVVPVYICIYIYICMQLIYLSTYLAIYVFACAPNRVSMSSLRICLANQSTLSFVSVSIYVSI